MTMIETRFHVMGEKTELPGADLPAPPAVDNYIVFAGNPQMFVVKSVTWLLAPTPEVAPTLVVLLKRVPGGNVVLPTKPEEL